MVKNPVLVSVILPTHNRKNSVRRALDSLRRQTYPPEHFEVLVIADGCTDGTADMVHGHDLPFSVQVIEEEHRGPAAARNLGSFSAAGEVLVFLDDDIEAAPTLIEAYVSIHQQRSDCVAIGYCPPVLQEQSGYFRMALQNWWENMFDVMRQPGHRCTYRDLLSGNFSIRRELFHRVGRFDPDFRCHEDYELGLRLIKADIPFVFVPAALGYHHESSDIRRSLQRKHEEGRADVLLGYRHPELRSGLPFARFKGTTSRFRPRKRALAFIFPGLGKKLVLGSGPLLGFFEKARLYRRWHQCLDFFLDLSYWLGVAEESGGQAVFCDLMQAGLSEKHEGDPESEVDLSAGLEAAEQLLDEKRATRLRVRFGRHEIGRIPPQPGSEPLRGIHLRRVLATDLSKPLLRALALEGMIDIPFQLDRLVGPGGRSK